LGRCIHTVKKNRETLEVTSKDIGLDVTAEKSMAMFQDQLAG
jgi:hypothetical protein